MNGRQHVSSAMPVEDENVEPVQQKLPEVILHGLSRVT